MPRRSRLALALGLLTASLAGVAGAVDAGVGPAFAAAAAPAAVSASNPTPAVVTPTSTPAELFPGGIYRDGQTLPALATARAITEGRTEVAQQLAVISDRPIALWLGASWTGDLLRSKLARYRAAAAAQGTTPVFVLYALPNRDCGGYSSGGLTAEAYPAWVRTIADSLRGSRAAVLVEPDSLAMLTEARCPGEAARRLPLLRGAVDTLVDAGLAVYLDAGKSGWVSPADIAPRLEAAGVARARGFFTNVAAFSPVATERTFAEQVSARLGGKNYVIDTSRNGRTGVVGWCNPAGAGLGQPPQVAPGTTRLDALLWVKTPGVSDGSCGGAPAAGTWHEAMALSLVVQRAR